MVDISKSFYGVRALNHVSFDLREGEIHALCGENGAGKSTLMKILSGNYTHEEGEIYIGNQKENIRNTTDAERLGIAIVYQELSLSPTVSIAENIYMGREPCKFKMIDKKKMRADAQRFLDIVKLKLNPDTLVGLLSVAQMQLVQIAKALSLNARILVMDEPCSSLGEEDSENLFQILEELKGQGIGIIYIDHRMDNIFRICDRVTILRDGSTIATNDIEMVSRDELIQMMVGRPISSIFPKTAVPLPDCVLEVERLSNDKLQNVGFTLHKGEILGLGGLVGAGRSEIMRAVFGIDKRSRNTIIRLDERDVKIRRPAQAIRAGIGYVPEDRKLEGLFLFRNVIFNTVIVFLKKYCRMSFVSDKKIKAATEKCVENLHIKAGNLSGFVNHLSGGNQQKVVLSKWLLMDDMKVLMLDEPTRGIDVGAKYEIYKLIDQLANDGVAVLIITSELSELIGICDRIAVVNNGKISKILNRDEFSQETIMKYCV